MTRDTWTARSAHTELLSSGPCCVPPPRDPSFLFFSFLFFQMHHQKPNNKRTPNEIRVAFFPNKIGLLDLGLGFGARFEARNGKKKKLGD